MTNEEAILEARRKFAAGDFRRAVVSITPETLDWDGMILECGHRSAWCSKIRIDPAPPAHDNCRECAKEWIVQAAKTGAGE